MVGAAGPGQDLVGGVLVTGPECGGGGIQRLGGLEVLEPLR